MYLIAKDTSLIDKVMNNILQIKTKIESLFLVGILSFTVIGVFAPTIVSANSYSSITQVVKEKKITLDLKDKSIQTILSEIRRQTDIAFGFSEGINPNEMGNFSIKAENVTIENILNKLFFGTKYTFKILPDKVIIQKIDPLKTAPVQSKQEKVTIKGRIVDENGEPVTGATIIIAGTSDGVLSNVDGDFIIQAKTGSVLEVSFTGKQEIKYSVTREDSSLKLTMKNDIVAVDDVVVTGYQTISKERATGSFGTIDKKNLEKPATNLSSRLVGATTGLQASLNEDGSVKFFEIRGLSTLGHDNKPLIVVDGFPISGGDPIVSNSYKPGSEYTHRDDNVSSIFNSLNPNDIESIVVLKDAAAASIWGARSGNGVIVITTKKGAKGSKINVDFNAFVQVRQKMDLDYANPIANSVDQIRYEEHVFGKYGATLNTGKMDRTNFTQPYPYASLAMNEARLGKISEADKVATLDRLRQVNYQDDVYEYLLRNPITQNYNITVSGSGNAMQHTTSILYSKEDTHYVGSTNENILLNNKIGADIFKWLNFDFSTMFQSEKKINNGASLYEISALSPYEKLMNEDGSYANVVSGYYEPTKQGLPLDKFGYSNWNYNLLEDVRNRDRLTNNFNTRIQAMLTFKLMKGLNITSSFQYELYSGKTKNLYNEQTYKVRNEINRYTAYNPTTKVVGESGYPKGGILEQSESERKGYIFRNQVNFNRTFGKHNINAVAGLEFNSQDYNDRRSPVVYGYDENTLQTLSMPKLDSYKDVMNSYYTITENLNFFTENFQRFVSFYANAAYTYDNRYTVSGSARTDASNFITDDPKYRYSPMWSIGGLWNISNEKFFSEVRFVDYLRLRMTYGYNGNVDASTSFKPLIGISTDPYRDLYMASINSYGNPRLRWEKVASTDIGVDFSMWSGKLSGKIDYYSKHSKDVLANISIAATNGTTIQRINNAEILNRGIEFEFGTNLKLAKNIDFHANVGYSYNDNKIEKLFNTDNRLDTYMGREYKEGMNTSQLYMFEYAGFNADGIPSVYGPDRAVYPMNETSLYSLEDVSNWIQSPGVSVAPHLMNINLGFRIKDFDISMIVTGKFGHKFTRSIFNYPRTGAKFNAHKDAALVLDNDPSVLPLPADETTFGMNNYRYYTERSNGNSVLDIFYENANHIRFQEVNLSYNLPSRVAKKIGMQRASVYVQANNLGIISATKYDLDPEFKEGSVKPRLSMIFGVKVSF